MCMTMTGCVLFKAIVALSLMACATSVGIVASKPEHAGLRHFGKCASGEGSKYREELRFQKCGGVAGICLQTKACPWDKVLVDHSDDCIAQANRVCCNVVRKIESFDSLMHFI